MIIEPDGDWATAAEEDLRRRLQPRRPVVHLDATRATCTSRRRGAVRRRAGRPRRDARRRRPARSRHRRVRAHLRRATATGSQSWIDEAVAGGAAIARAAARSTVGVLRPTVLTDVTPDMQVCRDEVFGPVVAVQTYPTRTEALALANDTRYGLQAAIFTADLDRALRGRPHARLRWRARQRGADVARRPDALRRRPRQREHARGPRLPRAGDDRVAPHHRAA